MSIDIRKFILALLFAIALIVWVVSMTGCDTTKRAERRQNQILLTHPNVAMVAIRKIAPCVDLKSDTTIVTVDTTVLVDCPDWSDTSTAKYFTIHDTAFFNNIIIRKIKVPVTIPAKTITIVKEMEDLSKVIELDNKLTNADNKNTDLEAKLKSRNKLILWLIVFLVGLSIPYIIRIVKFFTLPKIPIKL